MVDNGVVLVGAGGVLDLHVRFARVLLLVIAARNQTSLSVPNVVAIQNDIIG